MRPNLKMIRRVPAMLFLLIVVYFILGMAMCYGTIGRTKLIEVERGFGIKRTYQRIDLKEGYFVTGFTGELRWKVKNMKEALLLHMGDKNGTINFYDLFYLLIFNLAIYRMVGKLNEDTIFSDQLLKGLTIIWYLVIMYPFFNIVSDVIARRSITALTDGRFSVEFEQINVIKFFLFAFLFRLVHLFVKKGISLQQENELTI